MPGNEHRVWQTQQTHVVALHQLHTLLPDFDKFRLKTSVCFTLRFFG
jgi:hypothetical protein